MFARKKSVALALTVVVVLSPVPVGATGRASLTLDNASGDDALVRVDGPTTGYVEVPNTSSRTISVTGGTYRLFVRYGKRSLQLQPGRAVHDHRQRPGMGGSDYYPP